MRKKRLQERKLSSEYVTDARKWADHLVMKEYQGPGQMDRAMDRAAQKTGLDRYVFWSLRYRPPTDILVSIYDRLKTAYEAETERQKRLADHERQLTRASNGIVKAMVAAGDLLDCPESEQD